MKFRFYEVSFENDATGTGFGADYVEKQNAAKKHAAAIAQAEWESSEGDHNTSTDFSSVTIQEYLITGTPKQIAASCLVAAGGGDEADWIGFPRAAITRGQRWKVTYGGRIALDKE